MSERKEYDPQMHSAEHILNQTMVRMFNCGRSFSNHIEKKKSKCDYRFERNLSQEEINEIEQKVNEVIKSGVDVSAEMMPVNIAEKSFNLERLPEGSGDSVRIVRIGEYDACPCIGTHVSNTGQIGTFRIISTSYESGVLRIRFKVV